jgi:glycosyltransferase involved in cell wall biosynthesis
VRIAIDVQPLQFSARDAGIGRYLRNLLEHLTPIANGHDLRLLLNARVDPSRNLKLGTAACWPTILLERPGDHGDEDWLVEQQRYPALLQADDIDVFHANSVAELHGITTPRPTGRCGVVVTVHDIIPWLFPEDHEAYWPRGSSSYDFRRRLADVACADAILVPSEHTKRDLVAHLGMSGDRVTVTPEAAEDRFAPVRDEARLAAVRRTYGLPDIFILYVGGYYSSRKNISGLLDAYDKFLQEPGTEGVKLVLAGARAAWGTAAGAWQRRLAGPLFRDRVVTTEFIADDDLPGVYSAATLFVYPSLYEGFGLPPLEAMACETPVVTSAASSLGELVGEAALQVNPQDADAMAAAMIALWRDPPLRSRMAAAGRARSNDFSWQRTAETTLSVYEQVFAARSNA